jgi:heme exporter protein B
VFALLFRVDLSPAIAALALVVGLADVAICSVGTLFSSMSVRSRFREVLLPVLLIPSLIPVLAAAVRATTTVIAGERLALPAVQPLIVIAGIYLVLGFLLFDPVLDD